MPDYDDSNLEYWAQEQMNYRAHIWKPQATQRPVAVGGEVGDDIYGAPWLTNVPFGKRPARTGNDAFVVGSLERDIILTFDLAFFPPDVHLEADYFYQDVTILHDGVLSEKYGVFYSVRGETSEWIYTETNICGANRVPALAERNPPPGATGYVTPSGVTYYTA